MPRTIARNRPSPIETIKIGRRCVSVGDRITLPVQVRLIWPGRTEDRPEVTIELPDGTRFTIGAHLLEERE